MLATTSMDATISRPSLLRYGRPHARSSSLIGHSIQNSIFAEALATLAVGGGDDGDDDDEVTRASTAQKKTRTRTNAI